MPIDCFTITSIAGHCSPPGEIGSWYVAGSKYYLSNIQRGRGLIVVV